MYKIAIDHMPLTADPLNANDFCSYYIFSLIMFPLFKYNNNGILENYACKSVILKNKTYYIELKDNVKFYNGQRATIEDYYNVFTRIIESSTFPKYLLENVKKIIRNNNELIITLKRKDIFFLHKLSYYAFSPIYDKLTCGPYFVDIIEQQSITLKRNPQFTFFAKKNINCLKFEKFSNKEDIKSFLHNEINMTNITTFPLEKVQKLKPKIQESNLMFVLKFNPNLLTRKYKALRQFIAKVIDKNKINKELNNMFTIKNNFCLYNNINLELDTKQKKAIKITELKNIKLGYTNFYPNKIIANVIKKELTKNNIKVKLSKYNLCEINNCDLYIDIIFSPFFYDEYFYLSKYFRIINGRKYNKLCNAYEKNKNEKVYKKIINICNNKANVIPLLKNKYIFLCSDELKNVDQNRVNYYEI